MIPSLFFVLFVTGVVIISMAIPTLHLERTESAAGTGGRPRTRLAWNQVNISPYRGVWMSSWILFLILCYTDGRATLPPLDLRLPITQSATATPPAGPATRPTRQENPPPLPPPADGAESPSPPAPAVTADQPQAPTQGKKEEDMDRNRGRIPDWAKRDDPIL